MRYWFTIKDTIPEEVARKLWDNISMYNANLTVLPDRVYIYGDTEEPSVLEKIARAIASTGYPAERG